MERPEPAAVVSQTPSGLFRQTVLELENGATVILLETDIARELVGFGAESFGGWSVVAPEDAIEAQLVSDIVTQSGAGPLDQIELERLLEDKTAFVVPFISETSEGFFGVASTDDLETMLQLVHLYMTQPVADPVAFDLLVDGLRPLAASPDANPDLALISAFLEARFGDDSRYQAVPPLDDIDTFDLDRALEIYRQRFADAGDFVFVFAGDFDSDVVRDLSRSYLGTLPGAGEPEVSAAVRPDPPPGIVERVVEAGQGELAAVLFSWTTALDLDPETRLEADLLELIMQQRLTETIREELSVTYSPGINVETEDEPRQAIDVVVQVSGDPERLGEVSAAVLTVAEDIRVNGPTADELAIAQEQLVRNMELVSNNFWIETLLFYELHPGEDPRDVVRRFDRVDNVTIGDIAALAARVLPADRYIEVRLVPEGFTRG